MIEGNIYILKRFVKVKVCGVEMLSREVEDHSHINQWASGVNIAMAGFQDNTTHVNSSDNTTYI